MANWDILIRDAISHYQLIFVDDDGDRRLPCEIDPEIFKCHGIDKIQLCAYCFAMNENLLAKLKWEIEEKNNVYYFYPTADGEFQEALARMKDTYPECNIRSNYLENGKLTSVYRICEGRKEAEMKSCPLIVDMIFHMNCRGRSKVELDNFIALFFCVHIVILKEFLLKAEEYMQSLDKGKRRQLLQEIVNIMNKVLIIRKHIDSKDKQEDICGELRKLRKSSAKIITLRHSEKKQVSIRENFVQNFEYKMNVAFSKSEEWKYNRNIQGKNCRDLFRSLVKKCFEGVRFESVKGVEAIETGIKDVKKAQKLLNTEEK